MVRDTTVTTSTNMRSTTSRSSTTRVSHGSSIYCSAARLRETTDTKEEDLIHPEDIAHFAKHDREDEEEERLALLDQQAIVDANIPAMFRRKSRQ